MTKTLAETFNKTEEIYKNLRTQYNLKIPPDNWTHQILKLLKELKHAFASIKNQEEKDEFLKNFSERYGEKYAYGMVLLSELFFIYDRLDFKNQNKALLKKKLTKIFKSPLLPKDETNENNEFRNTLFELRLCAHINYHFGYSAKLHDPNPDIIVPIHENGKLKRTYFIECKRAFSSGENTLKDRVSEAKGTLIKHLNNDNAYGIIALCVGRLMIQGGKTWRIVAKPEESIKQAALRTVGSRLASFSGTFQKKINYLMDNPKIVAIIYEFQGIAMEEKVNELNITLFRKVSENGFFDKDFPADKKRPQVYIPNLQEVISILAPPERHAFKRIVVPARFMHRYR